MVRSEAPLLQLEVIGFSPRREGEKAHEELVIAGFFALLQARLGVIGVFHILEPIVPSGMAGNERVPQIEAQAIVSGTNFAWGRERSGHAIDLCRNVRIRMTRRPAWLLPPPPR